MSAAYRIAVCGLPGFEELVAEIYLGDRFIGLVCEEDGPAVFHLELAPHDGSQRLTLELESFEAAIQRAKNELTRLRLDPGGHGP